MNTKIENAFMHLQVPNDTAVESEFQPMKNGECLRSYDSAAADYIHDQATFMSSRVVQHLHQMVSTVDISPK